MSGEEIAVKSGVEEDVKAPATNSASPLPSTFDNPTLSSPAKPSAGPSSPPKSADSSSHLVQPTPSHSHSGIIDLTSPQSSPSKRQSSTPSLTSNRPAPASPASSRPPSTQFDSSLRDRSGSLSASSARRISSSSASSSTAKNARSRSRASSKVRPKSMLGTNIILPESSTPTPSSTSEPKDKDKDKDTIPESNEQDPSVTTSVSASQIMDSSWGDQTESFQVILPEVIIRDFAYPPTDERYKGQGVVEDEGNTSESNVFRWPWKGDSGVGEGESSSSGGWGGFGFLGGWRNKSRTTDQDDRPTFEDEDDDPSDQDEEYEEGQEEGDEDQYYSSPAQSDSGSPSSYAYKILEPLSPSIEPRGYYRAAYPFQALSSSEMDLQEGDLVNLVGRGNGDPGWVIARKVNILEGKIVGVDEKVGLVPESYLERVEVIED